MLSLIQTRIWSITMKPLLTIGIILTVPLVALLSAEIMGPKKKA